MHDIFKMTKKKKNLISCLSINFSVTHDDESTNSVMTRVSVCLIYKVHNFSFAIYKIFMLQSERKLRLGAVLSNRVGVCPIS